MKNRRRSVGGVRHVLGRLTLVNRRLPAALLMENAVVVGGIAGAPGMEHIATLACKKRHGRGYLGVRTANGPW